MKKRIIITIVLCIVLAVGACAFAACGEDGPVEHTRYEYYSFEYDEELGGLILDVTYSGLLPEGALTLPSSSHYYDGDTDHDEALPVVAVAEGAFEGSSRITSVTFPSSLKSIGDSAFKNCRSLESVTLASEVAIGSEAFFGCSALETVSGGSVSAIGDTAFYGSLDLRTFSSTLTDGVTIGSRAFGHTGITAETLSVPSSADIADDAFSG